MFEDSVIIEKLKHHDSNEDIINDALHHHAPSAVFKPNIETDSQNCKREELENLLSTLRRAHHTIILVGSEHALSPYRFTTTSDPRYSPFD